MKRITLLICISLPWFTYAQVKFESGYIIDSQGVKKNVLIKNQDWEYNPEKIEFIEHEGAEAKILTYSDVKEFAIGDLKKYVSTLVKVDSSTDDFKMFTSRIAPYWQSKMIFARVLAEGKMNLYSYKTAKYQRFYYKLNTDSITPLVYKRYLAKSDQIGYNKQYIMQLESLLDCGGLNKNINTSYTAQSLSDLISKYNICTNSSGPSYRAEKKLAFMFKATAGINYSSYKATIDGGFLSKTAEFDQKITPRFGLEIEMLLPYWDNRWSIVFDPNYRTYKGTVTKGADEFSVDYSSIELPIGARAHFFLKESNQIFADVFYVGDKNLGDAPIDMDGSIFERKSVPNFGLGVGYNSNRVSTSIRLHSLRNIAANYIALKNSFKNISLIVAYRLIRTK